MGNEGLMAFAAGDAETSQALSALRSLDLGGCGADEAGLVAFAEALAGGAARLPRLETLVVGGNPGTQGDAWEPALERLRETRPGLDVAWESRGRGENPETEEMRARTSSREAREAERRLLLRRVPFGVKYLPFVLPLALALNTVRRPSKRLYRSYHPHASAHL